MVQENLTDHIIFVGDVHAGSRCAPWPSDMRSEFGTGVVSEYLADCFSDFTSRMPAGSTLVLNGDLVDGPQRKSGGMGLFTPVLSQQVDAAISLIGPLARKASRIYRIVGTPYHDDDHGPLSAFDRALGVHSVRQVFNFRLGESILNVAHHPGGGSTLYTGTKSSREMMKATVAAARRKIPGVRWIVRSHLHHWNLHHEEGMTYMGLPCWQMPTPWAVKGDYFGWQPAIGAAEMFRDDQEPGGWRFRPHLYEVPQEEVEYIG